MQTELELQKELDLFNSQISELNLKIVELREKALRIAGKIELLQDQAKEKKK